MTLGEAEFDGSTVFSFLINGSPSTDFRSRRVRSSTSRSNHRLLVWKKGCRNSSVKKCISDFGVWAVSRKISWRSDLRIARCPPLRSAAVRRHTSAAYGAPLAANHPAIVAFGPAPRLSEFDTDA